MLDYEGGVFVELDLGFTPSPSGGGMFLLQEEEVHDGFLLLYGYMPSLHAPDREEGTALVTIVGLSQSVFGYPSEEAFWLDNRGDVGHGFYELQASKWLENVMQYNERTYGSRNSVSELGGKYEAARHFFIGSAGGAVHGSAVQGRSGRGPSKNGKLVRRARCAAQPRAARAVVSERRRIAGGERSIPT